ncbi:MAG: four-carbon acid sugar kinase family protein [Clostridia bacterium]
MNEQVLSQTVLQSYPAYDCLEIHNALDTVLAAFHQKIVVLDDDPTGIQTVHDVSVYTNWSCEMMRFAFEQPDSMFFILTNSRAFSAEKSEQIHREIAHNLVAASHETGKEFLIISRSDSTLRGHYPLETETLREVLETEASQKIDGEILLPFFREGGRYTLANVHYVAMDNVLVPAGQTEFARDKTFGYQASNLKEWIAEKTKGAYPAQSVLHIGLDELRSKNFLQIEEKLMCMRDFSKLVVNAIDTLDVEVFAIALVAALSKGKHYLFRSAAALPKCLGGVSDKPLLTREELADPDNPNGGLIMIGSHVQKTTIQLAYLRKANFIEFIELNQHLVLDALQWKAELKRVSHKAEHCIAEGKTVAVFTRRERFDLNTGNKEDELRLATQISDALTGIVAHMPVRPSFIIAKGGITSSDVGTKSLKVERALVLGQILPGVPVWRTGSESLFPKLPYVIFPGNVGGEDALYQAVMKMQKEE